MAETLAGVELLNPEWLTQLNRETDHADVDELICSYRAVVVALREQVAETEGLRAAHRGAGRPVGQGSRGRARRG